MQKKLACLIYGNQQHYIDHIAPLSYLLDIPLLTNDVDVETKVRTFYPEVDCLWQDTPDLARRVGDCDAVISCMAGGYLKPVLQAHAPSKKSPTYIFCPHGNSDKDNLQMLEKETHLFVYGKQMQERLPRSSFEQNIFFFGDYRRQYYAKKRAFYQKLSASFLPRSLQKSSYFLYTPTWADYERHFSLERLTCFLRQFPRNVPLVVKLHPNTWLQDEPHLLRLQYTYESQHCCFLENIPLIYPFVERCRAHIGDGSSIGYDALLLGKPLFFYTRKQKRSLFSYGKHLFRKNCPQALRNAHIDQKKSTEFAAYVFTKNVCLRTLKKNLIARL
ncbi:MAG: hypothetical protein AAGF04_03760 [Chlamydiota bacterium]